MQPFVNPYLFNQFQGMNPGIYPNNNNLMQQQAQGMAGRYVNDFSEITANDVPMGGQPAVFIKNDRGEIQLREWSPNGQIITTLYKPQIEPKQSEVSNVSNIPQQPLFDAKTEILEPIFNKLADLEQQVAKLSKSTTRKVAE